jgi:hypothetical protein
MAALPCLNRSIRIDFNAHPGAPHLSVREQIVSNAAGTVDRHREPKANAPLCRADDRRVHTDYFTQCVDERSA